MRHKARISLTIAALAAGVGTVVVAQADAGAKSTGAGSIAIQGSSAVASTVIPKVVRAGLFYVGGLDDPAKIAVKLDGPLYRRNAQGQRITGVLVFPEGTPSKNLGDFYTTGFSHLGPPSSLCYVALAGGTQSRLNLDLAVGPGSRGLQ
jgi:hypothetical protein